MEIRDYVRMLKRGWPAIVLITLLILGLTVVYLTLAPKRYEARAVLYVSPSNPQSFSDLSQGSTVAGTAITTYAEIIDSATVLGQVAESLRPQRDIDEVAEMVTVSVRPETRLIDVTASGSSPEEVAEIANRTSKNAINVLTTLEKNRKGRTLLQITLLRSATEPTQASNPVVRRTLALGLIVGVCAGLGGTLASQALDTRIRTVDEVRQLTSVPMLAVLPPLSRAERQGLVVRDKPNGRAGEAYRTLRTNMRFRESKDQKSFVFAAVSDDRGGAQIPINFAWTLAQAGQNVLLVDLDLRHSRVGDVLELTSGPGMADILMGQLTLKKAVLPTKHPCLSAIRSGTPQPSPSELLSAADVGLLLREMEQQYDCVLIHVPPLLSFTDAALIAGVAGGTFITVTAGRTRAQELTTAISTLTNVRVQPHGLVLASAGRSALEHGAIGATPSRARFDNTRQAVDRPGQSVNSVKTTTGSGVAASRIDAFLATGVPSFYARACSSHPVFVHLPLESS